MNQNISFFELSNLNKKNNKQLLNFLKSKKREPFKKLSFKQNEIIFESQSNGKILYVLSGYVLRSFLDIEGNNKPLDILSEDEFLGISSVRNGVPALSELVAITHTEVLELPEEIFLKFPTEVLPVLYSNYQYTFCVLYLTWRASLAPGNERVNTALISIAYYMGSVENGSYCLPQFITHQIIADFSSVSRSYVTRCLRDLKSQGIIEVNTKRIVIYDIETLKDYTPSYQPF